MDMQEKKKYIQMENILNKINQKYISLPASEVKRNNKILEQVIDPLTDKIKEKSVLFKNMYERKFYGGSFYDGLKVGKPEEYDLDYVVNLPLLIEPQVEISNKPGFVHVCVKEFAKLAKNHEKGRYDKLDTLMLDDYLSTDKVLQWMEKIINLALNEFVKTPDGYQFDVAISEDEIVQFYATVSKSHPAFTLKIKNIDGSIYLDIDLVPCFQFGEEQWPKGQYRKNSTERKKFLVVPKKPYHVMKGDDVEKYWRLSFQEQERVLITGSDLKALKPSIKLLKKLRDQHNHKIASYFIKTVFLWEVHNVENKGLWGQAFSYVFMRMLKKYTELIKNKCIPYYWNKNFNLIGHIKDVTLTDIGNTLKRIIDRIEEKSDEPFTIAKYLVQSDSLEELRSEVQLGKKFLKKQLCFASLDTSSSNNSDVSGVSVEEIEENQPETSPDDTNKLQAALKQMDELYLNSEESSSKSFDNADVSSASIEDNTELLAVQDKLDRKMHNPERLRFTNRTTKSKYLDNSDIPGANIQIHGENQSMAVTKLRADNNNELLNAQEKLTNNKQPCFSRYATKSKSLDNPNVVSATIKKNGESQSEVEAEARADDNNKLLEALEKLDRKTDDIVTKLVTLNKNMLKIRSDLTERMDDLEDKMDGLKKLIRNSTRNSDPLQMIV